MYKKFIFAFLIAIIFFGIGFFSGKFYFAGKQVAVPVNTKNTYEAGWEAAIKRLKEVGTVQLPPDNIVINSLAGTVSEVSGKKIKAKIIPIDVFSEPDLDNRIIAIDDNTKIIKIEKKEDGQYQKEYDEYIKKSGNASTTPDFDPNMPKQFNESDGQINDLKAGTKIIVESDANINKLKEFTAKKIVIQANF